MAASFRKSNRSVHAGPDPRSLSPRWIPWFSLRWGVATNPDSSYCSASSSLFPRLPWRRLAASCGSSTTTVHAGACLTRGD